MRTSRVVSAREVFLTSAKLTNNDQSELEAAFFKSISACNGSHKTTVASRLKDVDQLICDHFQHSTSVDLLEAGLSSGVTTLELLERLEASGIQTQGWGVDICVQATLYSLLGIDVLYDSANRAVQIATPFFTRGRPHDSQRSLRSRLLRVTFGLLGTSVVSRIVKSLGHAHPITLITRKLTQSCRFNVKELDIARPYINWNESFDLIRAANLLNLDYFPKHEIGQMVQNLSTWLKPGGILVICRTHADGSNHGSFYQRQSVGLRLDRICSFGEGYELDHCQPSLLDDDLNKYRLA